MEDDAQRRLKESRRKLYDALADYIKENEPHLEGAILTKAIVIFEVQEPLRSSQTLCYRTLDLNMAGMKSWDMLGFLHSAILTTQEMASTSTYDPEDKPDNDLEADDDG